MFKRDKYAPKNIQAIDKVKERRLNNLNFIEQVKNYLTKYKGIEYQSILHLVGMGGIGTL